MSGWAKANDVVPVEHGIEFFTNQVRANPQDAHSYVMRAILWRDKKELDIALRDYNEAIRLEPTHAWVFTNRGDAWNAKKDYDMAIADYNVAIRLDPQDAFFYNNRGVAWLANKDYNKAIADCNEAIRLDPQYALAYNNRGNARSAKKEYDKAIADYNEAIRLDPKDADSLNARAWLWATCPDGKYRDGKKAVESATKACELSEWKEAYPVGTLGADVRRARELLAMSQAAFAAFLGVDPSAVRSWEQALGPLSPLACRPLSEIDADPIHWRKRLAVYLVGGRRT